VKPAQFSEIERAIREPERFLERRKQLRRLSPFSFGGVLGGIPSEFSRRVESNMIESGLIDGALTQSQRWQGVVRAARGKVKRGCIGIDIEP